MIQVQTELNVADNTGAKRGMYQSPWRFKRRYASVGDIIVISVKDAIPKGVKRSSTQSCRSKNKRKFLETMVQKLTDTNAVVLTDEKGEPIGTRIFGPVTRELR